MASWKFVRLISSDGHEFFADEKVLRQCELIGKMLDSGLAESGFNKTLTLPTDCLLLFVDH